MWLQVEREKAETERLKTEKKAELARKQDEAKQRAETAKKQRSEEALRKKQAAEAAMQSPRSPIRFIGLPDDEDDINPQAGTCLQAACSDCQRRS